MGRKSKLKQERRTQKKADSSSNWKDDVITIGKETKDWIFILGKFTESSSKILHQGEIDECINALAKYYPSAINDSDKIKDHCYEYGLLDADEWAIIAKPLFEAFQKRMKAK